MKTVPPPIVPLVATKLKPPIVPTGYQARARIDRLLDSGLGDAVHLTLVAAPPGYGKTVAVAAWAASIDLPVAWLSLDTEDGDLARFVRYLAMALSPARPGAVEACAALAGPGAAPDPGVVAATLLDVIGRSDDPFVLVLDDFHVITEQAVHAVVRSLAERAPPFCHLFVLGREDPPLPLARLRAHGRLVEVRADDLRFAGDEAWTYLASAGLILEPGQARRLLDRTEGWIVGLQLAAISIARTPDTAAAIDAFGRNQRFVLEYLADEVVDRVDDDLRSFLVRTSVVDRFTDELCAAIAECTPDEANLLIGRARRAHLFIVPLDDEGAWYRYHHLFADYLRSRLAPAERGAYHRRAAAWLERNGHVREAISHLFRAAAVDEALCLIEFEARGAFEAGELSTLLAWFEAVPDERLARSSELLSWYAWTLFDTGQLGAAYTLAQRHLARTGAGVAGDSTVPSAAGVPANLPGGPPEGRLMILQALLQTVTGPGAELLARSGLDLVGDDDLFRSSGLQAIGLARLARGDSQGAVECLAEAFEVSRRLGPAAAFGGLTPVVQALNAAGRRAEAEALCASVVAEYLPGSSVPPPLAWYLDVVMGMLRYEANDVAEARRLLDRGFEVAARLRVGRTMVEWGVAYLALARCADGSPEAAIDALRIASRDMRASGVRLPVPVAETEARIRLVLGDVEAAARWADEPIVEAAADSPLRRILELSGSLTIARVRLAQRRPEEVAAILRPTEAACRASGAVADLISVLALLACAAQMRDRRAEAVRLLGEAVRLAAPGGYVRRLVEDGAALARVLPLVRRQAPQFVDGVILALARTATGRSSPAADRAPALWPTDAGLIEALTARELEVLRLLATGSRNDEIGSALGVSTGTARWHVGNVLAKLGTSSRAKAVGRARELGLV